MTDSSSSLGSYGAMVMAARRKSGKSREQVAENVGIHPKSLARIERGDVEPRDDTKKALAAELEEPKLFSEFEVQQRENAVEYTARHYGVTAAQVRDSASVMFRAASERCLADWSRDVEEARLAVIKLQDLARRWPHMKALIAKDAIELLEKDVAAIERRDISGRHVDWSRVAEPEDIFGENVWPLAAWLTREEAPASRQINAMFDFSEDGGREDQSPLFWPAPNMSPQDHFIDVPTSELLLSSKVDPMDLLGGTVSYKQADEGQLGRLASETRSI